MLNRKMYENRNHVEEDQEDTFGNCQFCISQSDNGKCMGDCFVDHTVNSKTTLSLSIINVKKIWRTENSVRTKH